MQGAEPYSTANKDLLIRCFIVKDAQVSMWYFL